jgi:hypothetical protein
VLTFDGHRGEVLIGRSTPNPDSSASEAPPVSAPGGVLARVWAPDGTEQYDASGLLYGQAYALPADGRYTFVFEALGRAPSSATVWDYANAPASVQQLSPGGQPTCSYTDISSSCSSYGSSTYVIGGLNFLGGQSKSSSSGESGSAGSSGGISGSGSSPRATLVAPGPAP